MTVLQLKYFFCVLMLQVLNNKFILSSLSLFTKLKNIDNVYHETKRLFFKY